MPENRYYSRVVFFIISLFTLTFPSLLFAAPIPENNNLDNIIKVYSAATLAWEPVIHNLTLGLFWGLVTISFTWSSIQIALKGGGLVDVIADLTTRVLTVGFAVWLIDNAPDLARVLIESFQEVGSRLSGGLIKFSPSSVVELAINVISVVFEKISIWDPTLSLMLFLTALVILICFALVAMEMMILIITAYVTVSGGIVMMGFLGSEWTRENAMNYFTAVLGIAVKMFVMQLIFILGYGFINEWTSAMDTDSPNTHYLALLGVSIVFYGLIREIPQMAASLASGRFTMAGGGMQAAVGAAVGMAAGAALAATGMGAAAASAASSSMSEEETAANEASTLKRSLDTGRDPPPGGTGNTSPPSDSPSSPSSSSASSSPLPSESPSSPRSTSQKLMSATGAGLKAAAKAGGKVAKGTALSSLQSLAQQSTVGSALARAGVDLMKLDTSDPKQTQAAHQALMKEFNMSKDDGNDRNNYRETQEAADERHKRFKDKSDT